MLIHRQLFGNPEVRFASSRRGLMGRGNFVLLVWRQGETTNNTPEKVGLKLKSLRNSNEDGCVQSRRTVAA
jgi:hypothetical protein